MKQVLRMKSKIIFTHIAILFFLSFSNCLFGQKKHEIKLDAFSFLARDIQFSYEYLLNGKSGVEVDFRFVNERRFYDYSSTFPPTGNSFEAFHKRLMTQLSYNKYPFAKGEAKRLVVGGFARYIFYTKIDEEYQFFHCRK